MSERERSRRLDPDGVAGGSRYAVRRADRGAGVEVRA